MNLFDRIKLDSQGLISAIIQHHETGQVLMLGYMNEESLGITLKGGKACFWSRSRQELWLKGETSGNMLHVEEIRVDCDCDAIDGGAAAALAASIFHFREHTIAEAKEFLAKNGVAVRC